jgi:hypothetical protein
VSTADQAPPEPPVSAGTVAAWRRRRQACELLPSCPDHDKPAKTLQPETEAAIADSAAVAARVSIESQHAGLIAMMELAQAPALPTQIPVAEPHSSRPASTASLQDGAVSVASAARSVEVVEARGAPGGGKSSWWFRPLPMLAILFVQADLSLRLIWSNTAFMDEALYLRAGHIEIAHWLHGTYGSSIAFFPTYFSGAPVIYPPVGALADSIGGLAGARLLSLCFMLGATMLLYAVAGRLFDRRAALAGAALFAVLGATQNLGAFATYDAMALFLTALAAWLVIRARGWMSEPLLIAAALVMTLADATKYASALWDPVIIVLAMTLSGRGNWLRAVARGLRLALYLAGILCATVLIAGPAYWKGITFTTLARASSTASAHAVIGRAYGWIGAIFLLALLGAAFSFSRSWRDRGTCIALALAVVLSPLEQARIGTLTSLQKHVDFGAWFGVIVAGYAIAWMADYNRARGWRLAAVALPFVLIVGMFQSSAMFRVWPNMSSAMQAIARAARQNPEKCLASENEVISYYLPQEVPTPNNCTGSYFFAHWDARRQRELFGTAAYVFAIRHHYFAWIEADPEEESSPRSPFYAPVISAARAAGYHLAAVLPDNTSSTARPIQIWVTNPVGKP